MCIRDSNGSGQVFGNRQLPLEEKKGETVMAYIAPSLLAADFSALGKELERVREAEILHIDIMDGCFVPNLSMGPQVVQALRPKGGQVFDVHLMLVHPLPYIASFRKAGADWITFHIESQDNPGKVIDAIVESGAKPGLALRPGTPVEELYPYGERLHSVTVIDVYKRQLVYNTTAFWKMQPFFSKIFKNL